MDPGIGLLHNSISRPGSWSRSKSRSTPTKGDFRKKSARLPRLTALARTLEISGLGFSSNSGMTIQSAGMGAGFATAAGTLAASPGVSATTSNHFRTAGSALRMATSPARMSSSARLKSS